MSQIEILIIVLLAVNISGVIFLLFERDRLLKKINQHNKWLCNLDEKARRTVDHVNIIGAKVFQRNS